MSKYCINCGAELTVGTKFCVSCGTKLEAKKPVGKLKPSQEFCTNCGTKLPEGTKFCVECGAKFEDKKPIEKPTEPIKETIEKPKPPKEPKIAAIPPPPPPTISKPMPPSYAPPLIPKSKLKVIGAVAVVAILLVAVFYVGFMMGGNGGGEVGGGVNKVDITTGDNIPVVTSQSVVDYSGGTISVTDSSNPLYGLKIEVPEAAISISDEVDFDISYADITDISGLPEGASVASKMINIKTDGTDIWNKYKAFDKPCTITLPYDPNIVTNEDSVRFYYYDEENDVLDSTGFISQDKSSDTITFYTGTFSNFTAIEISLAVHEFFGQGYSVDPGFRPATDGWFIENLGSYLTGGNCLGMTSYAKWYYRYKKPTTNEGLYSKHIEGDPDEWRDDETAIQLATRCQMGTQGIASSLSQDEDEWAVTKSHDVAYSIIHGMIVSGEPQLVGLALLLQNNTWAEGRHAVLAYRYAGGRFDIYDPNYPGTAPGTDVRQIPFTYNDGFTRSYSSGQTAVQGRQYNIFYHAGAKTYSPANAYSGLYDSAEKKFEDDTIFPTVTLTSPSTPIDTDDDGIRDTTESKATISGTITGGQQEISSTLIFVSNQKFETAVDATTHEFSKEVPLFAGENEIIILATDENTWDDWAGFLKDSIKSSASEASLTFTMTWGQGQSDVDLHVLEPTINTTAGRHIYYGNKGHGTQDIHPYLDVDNTRGYGPEHYYATQEMTLTNSESLYGTYKFRVHYYKDWDDDDENTQPIAWHVSVRYLAFKDELTGEEYWEENAWGGSLAFESTSNTGNFDNTGPSWDTIYTVTYPQPNPEDYGIPPPPQNELPD